MKRCLNDRSLSAYARGFDTIRKLSDTDANILILGENGTGKDLVARSLRYFLLVVNVLL